MRNLNLRLLLALLAVTAILPTTPAVSVDSAPALDGPGNATVYLPLVIR